MSWSPPSLRPAIPQTDIDIEGHLTIQKIRECYPDFLVVTEGDDRKRLNTGVHGSKYDVIHEPTMTYMSCVGVLTLKSCLRLIQDWGTDQHGSYWRQPDWKRLVEWGSEA